MQRIKKGDKVRVISGKLKPQEGIVLLVNNKKQAAIVEGLNKVKLHRKANAKQEKGGITEKEALLPLSKLALVAPKSSTGVSRISYRVEKDGKKLRIAKKTNVAIGASKAKAK
ncbi:MAG: 50S ribosomal protein L24 [Mycoplasmataceae bacterium]|jgi:large subunit ribosomal protein L24|nr:50S ribosomal protein L24 [Mycoplasmataceae bacterium]